METNAILIVDDEPNIINALKRTFADDPYEVFSAENAADGMAFLSERKIKLVISDEMMPGMTGVEFLAQVKIRYPNIIRMMLTGHASLDAAIKAINMGAIYRFFTKPWNDLELRFSVKAGIDKYNLEEENRRLLRIIRKQAMNLKSLEKEFPGISRVKYDNKGCIIVDDVSDEEIEKIVSELDRGPTK
jgi:two-component system, probable response regulator PhcQ